jgi:hypothetical protein
VRSRTWYLALYFSIEFYDLSASSHNIRCEPTQHYTLYEVNLEVLTNAVTKHLRKSRFVLMTVYFNTELIKDEVYEINSTCWFRPHWEECEDFCHTGVHSDWFASGPEWLCLHASTSAWYLQSLGSRRRRLHITECRHLHPESWEDSEESPWSCDIKEVTTSNLYVINFTFRFKLNMTLQAVTCYFRQIIQNTRNGLNVTKW